MDGSFDITLKCCGHRKLPLKRDRRETAIDLEHGLKKFSSRLGKRDIKDGTCPEPRIVGGHEAEPHSWPWMVSMVRKEDQMHRCGASLISQKYVLTAAHCLKQTKGVVDKSLFVVRVGSHIKTDGEDYPIEDILVYPKYRAGIIYHDIGLIRVEGLVELSDDVYPVCLPSNALVLNGTSFVTVIGWGRLSYKGEIPTALQEVEVPTVPLEECQANYRGECTVKEDIPKGITSDMICAGVAGKGACHGDSGGPLMKNVDGRWFQFGIVSFGVKCAEPKFGGVYTRISNYTQWIYENTDLGKNSDST